MQNFATSEWLGKLGVNLNDTVRLPDPENKGLGANRAQLSFTGTELYTALKSP